MTAEVLYSLGLSINESEIYSLLLSKGELSASAISKAARIHRRNVYDVLNRLCQKGLVVEVIQRAENVYQAVDPNKLAEFLDEKRELLRQVVPSLRELNRLKSPKLETTCYRGVEGWKQFLREILRLKADVFSIGSGWPLDHPAISSFARRFVVEAARKNIRFTVLCDCPSAWPEDPDLVLTSMSVNRLVTPFRSSALLVLFGNCFATVAMENSAKNVDEHVFSLTYDEHFASAAQSWFRLSVQGLSQGTVGRKGGTKRASDAR